ncbi:hypothetical protein SDJN02_01733, partial [Cucurbita argyrosperma subsp. argyrosperma]
MALRTAETVGMYAVLLRASSHVSPISWQSLLNILVALSVVLYLLECAEAFGATGVGCVAAILLQITHCRRWGGVVEAGEIECCWTRQGTYLVETNSTEAQYSVAAGIGLRNSDVSLHQRVL